MEADSCAWSRLPVLLVATRARCFCVDPPQARPIYISTTPLSARAPLTSPSASPSPSFLVSAGTRFLVLYSVSLVWQYVSYARQSTLKY